MGAKIVWWLLITWVSVNNKNSSNDYNVNITNLNQSIVEISPSDVYFNIPFVTAEQV